MLGSLSEAEDAVQETWLRLNRSDSTEIENLSGWLTTVVSRVCLDMLRSKQSRREETLESQEGRSQNGDPEEEALMADSVGIAVLVLLATLTPAERLAFVLHEMFDVSFEEIGSILGRSSAAARQLASRARRRVRGNQESPSFELQSQRTVVDVSILMWLYEPTSHRGWRQERFVVRSSGQKVQLLMGTWPDLSVLR